MTLAVTHTKTLVSPSTTTEDKVSGSDYVSATSHTITGAGTMAEQHANAVAITGGTGRFTFGASALSPYYGTAPADFSSSSYLSLNATTTETADAQTYGFQLGFTVNPAAQSIGSHHAATIFIDTPSANAQTYDSLYAYEVIAVHNGSGNVASLYGVYSDVENSHDGHIDNMYGNSLNIINRADGGTTGTVGAMYGYSVFTVPADGVTTAYAFHSEDFAGMATNPYYEFYASRGVWRIKEDNSHNSVGQAVPAQYNPLFLQYTAGLANYERGTMYWDSNVFTFGTEAGGTGTQRALNLIGSALTFNGAAIGVSLSAPQTWTGVQQFGTIGGAVSKLAIAGSTSGKAILDAPAVAGTAVITLPGVTSTLATLGANTFTALQTFNASAGAAFPGSSSGTATLKAPAAAGTSTITLPGVTSTLATLGANNFVGDQSISGNLGVSTPLYDNGNTWRVVQNTGFVASSVTGLSWAQSSASNDTIDLKLTRAAAATLQQGAADAASPVAQRYVGQGSRAGTDSNVGAGDITFGPKLGTGTGTPASYIVKAPAVVASGTGAQTDTEIFRANTTSGLKVASGQPLQLGNAAVTGLAAGVLAATTNATVTITDSAGQVYRVPCII